MKSNFPSVRLVLAAIAVNFALGGFMLFGTLARLTELADGLEPFDLRPLGYSIGEARTLITLLGEEGRRYYFNVHQWVANIYPVTFLASRGLLLWWLTADGRLTERPIHRTWRCALLLLPAVELVPDYVENVRILEMLAAGPEVAVDVVESASAATQSKVLLTGLTELVALVLSLIALRRWWELRRRSAVR